MWYSMLRFGIYFWICLLYLINLLHFKEFFGISQIWTASDSNNKIKWVEKWYSCYGNEKKFRISCSGNTTMNVWPSGFQIIKKANEVWKSWDLSWYDDFICGGCGKKLRRFHIICHVRCLQTEASQKKNPNVEKDSLRFVVKVTVELGFDFQNFLYRQ